MHLNQFNGRLLVFSLISFVLTQTCHLRAESVETGKQVSFYYSVSTSDGKPVFSNFAGKPLNYIHGTRQLVPGLEAGLTGMEASQQKTFEVPASAAYGPIDSAKIKEVSRDSVAGELRVGEYLQGLLMAGQPVTARILEVRPETVLLDFNHPLAGKNLVYTVKVLSISDSPASS